MLPDVTRLSALEQTLEQQRRLMPPFNPTLQRLSF